MAYPGLIDRILRERMNAGMPPPDPVTQPAQSAQPTMAPPSFEGKELIDRLIAQSQEPPGFLERFAKTEIPFSPIKKRKGREGRLFLRGAVSGLQAGGKQKSDAKTIQAFNAATRAQQGQESLRLRGEQQRLTDEDRDARRAQAEEKLQADIGNIQSMMQNRQIDNDQANKAFEQALKAFDETVRHNKVLEGQGQQRIDVSRQRLAKAKADANEVYAKLPQVLRDAHANSIKRVEASSLSDDEKSAQINAINALMVEQSLWLGTKGPKLEPVPPMAPAVVPGRSPKGGPSRKQKKEANKAKTAPQSTLDILQGSNP